MIRRQPYIPTRLAFVTWACLASTVVLTACGAGGGESGLLGALMGGSIDLDADATGINSIHLSWSKPSGGVTVSSYTVARNDERSRQALVSTPERFYTVKGLQPATRYCFEIRAPITANSMSNTACATTLTDSQPPSAPGELAAEAESPARIRLTWNRSSDQDGVTAYYVYRDGAFFATAQSTSLEDTEADPSTTYCYSVTATDASGNESRSSNQACATTPDDAEIPTVPANLTVVYRHAADHPTMTLQWSASTDDGAIRHYRIFRDGAHHADAQSTSHEDAIFERDTLYCYKVSAVDRAGKESDRTEDVCARSSWLSTRFDEQYVHAAAIGVDANGDPHLAYKHKVYDSTAGQHLVTLRYRNIARGYYSAAATLQRGIDTYWFSDTYLLAMAMDPAGIAHVAHKHRYENGSESVQHVKALQSGQGLASRVQNSQEQMRSIAIASDDIGALHMCMTLGSDLTYATNQSGNWTSVNASTLVAGAAGSGCDIALDSQGNVHMSYLESGSHDLMYLSDASGAWTVTRLDEYAGSVFLAASRTSIALDPAGKAHIAYLHDGDQRDLEYATNVSGAWQTGVLDSEGDVGYECDISVDSQGVAHAIYWNVTDARLVMYANNRSGTWQTGPLTSGALSPVAIALDTRDNAHVVVSRGPEGRLTYLTNSLPD